MQAIVLDGHLKSALATVRSLGVVGIKVYAGAERESAMGLHSRYVRRRFIYPSPYSDQGGFVAAVRKEADLIGGKPVVYAFSDATFLSLYAHREELSEVITIAYPDEKSVEIAFDKAATYSLARVSGIPTITTHMPVTKEEVRRLGEMLTYPVVVKTRRSVSFQNGRGAFGSATFVHDAEELEERFFIEKEKMGETPLVQVFVRGEEYGVEMLVEEGKIYARVVHHRLRSLSPTGGASVLKETLADGDLKNTLTQYAEILVQKLMWTGPIMVEFKVDADTREPYLMEINGRFWGSLPLSIFAGVNMPLLYHTALTTKNIPEQIVEGIERITSVHYMGDVLHLIRVLFARDPMREILYPKRSMAVRSFLLLPLGTQNDVWTFRDPKPAFMEFVDILKTKLWK